MENTKRKQVGKHLITEGAGFVRITALLLTLALGFVISACSDDGPVGSAFDDQSVGSSVHDYFPVQSGYSTAFSVTDSLGQELRVEYYSASGATIVNGLPGVNWSGYSMSDTSEIFAGSIFWDANGIYHLRSGASSAEVLLHMPLDSAASWDRWYAIGGEPVVDTGSGGSLNDETGGQGVDFEDKPGDEPSNTSFPTEGSSKFYIAGLHEDVTSGGNFFGNCLEVVNAGRSQTVNRYWYAQGVGLVKFSLNCQFGSDIGTENGELLNN